MKNSARTFLLAFSFISSFALMASAGTEISAPFSILRSDSESSYSTLAKAARLSNLNFFSDLEKGGVTSGLFKTHPENSFLPDLLFTRLETVPTRVLENCSAVFCRDLSLQEKLSDEAKKGRVILVANAFNGIIAAVPNESTETKALKRMFKASDSKKSILIITPKTLLSTLAHELTHAEDSETQALHPLFSHTQDLFKRGEISAANGRRINQFVGEVRAYDNELKYILKNSRHQEFVADDDLREGASPYQVQVQQVSKMDFLPQRIREIDWKVRNFYLKEFLSGLKDKSLSRKSRVGLLEMIRAHLPAAGPYSFAHLVQPRL